MIHLYPGDALIIVDVQNDFLPGGTLAVPKGSEIIPVLNRYIALFHNRGLPIFATRDWHPPNHNSFVQQGGQWQPHCIAGTSGAEFPAGLNLPSDTVIISKATRQEKDAYSGFDDTSLDSILKSSGVCRVFIGGVATEHCVLRTAKDAVRYRYTAFVLEDAVRAIDRIPEDGSRALDEMAGLDIVPLRFEMLSA
ncbi:MAG TPA: isochorismatase family protein [Nitrosospira sp.]|jgi:nicotinamidase/pyrazinamidase|nr:isochorismatase family protein [Nitrosospira sp.]